MFQPQLQMPMAFQAYCWVMFKIARAPGLLHVTECKSFHLPRLWFKMFFPCSMPLSSLYIRVTSSLCSNISFVIRFAFPFLSLFHSLLPTWRSFLDFFVAAGLASDSLMCFQNYNKNRLINIERLFLQGWGHSLVTLWRHATIGAAYIGHMDKLPKTDSAKMVWEALGHWS